MAIPMVMTQCSMALMQFADVWMVSGLEVGAIAALAAIAPAGMLLLVLASFGTGFLTSVSAFVGQSFGREDRERCSTYAWQGIWLAVTLGLALLAFLPTARYVFGFFNHEIEVYELEVIYFRICLWAVLPQLVATAIGNYFIGIHRPRVVLVGTLVATGLNFVFSYGLIFGRIGFPELGFAGAAWGTVAASVLHAMFLFVLFLRHTPVPRAPFSRRKIAEMVRVGLPAAVQDALDVISWGLIIIFLVGKFGKEHLAAATILIRCMQVSFLPSDGVGTALMALVARSVGAGRPRLARWQARAGMAIIGGYMGSMAVFFFLFRFQILRLFTDDPEVIRIGAQSMLWVSLFQIFDAMSVVYVHCLQGAGDTRWPSLVNFGLCIVILLGGGMFMVAKFPELQSFGVWMVSTAYICTQGVLFAYRWKRGKWENLSIFRSSTLKIRENESKN